MADTTVKDITAGLLENIPVLLIVSGIILFVLGAFGGISYKEILAIPDTVGRACLMAAGLVVFVIGILLPAQNRTLQPKKYDIKITSARDNDFLDKKVPFRGTFSKAPPKDYEIYVIRIYPNDDSYYPMRTASMNAAKTWEATDCDLGGNPNDTRIVAVCLGGLSTRAFFDYFKMAEKSHGRTLDLLHKANVMGGDYLPLIQKGMRPTDLIECHRIVVRRK